jgi:cofilin
MKLKHKSRYVIFKIGDEEIGVEKLGPRAATFEEFGKDLPFSDSRYAVYDQDLTTADGRATSKIWFISWSPTNSTPFNKMAYTVWYLFLCFVCLNQSCTRFATPFRFSHERI